MAFLMLPFTNGLSNFPQWNWKDGTSVTPDDFANLQKQIRRLQEENEILKKAMGIFVRK